MEIVYNNAFEFFICPETKTKKVAMTIFKRENTSIYLNNRIVFNGCRVTFKKVREYRNKKKKL